MVPPGAKPVCHYSLEDESGGAALLYIKSVESCYFVLKWKLVVILILISALGCLAEASFKYDSYGVVQKSLPSLISTLLYLQEVIIL